MFRNRGKMIQPGEGYSTAMRLAAFRGKRKAERLCNGGTGQEAACTAGEWNHIVFRSFPAKPHVSRFVEG